MPFLIQPTQNLGHEGPSPKTKARRLGPLWSGLCQFKQGVPERTR